MPLPYAPRIAILGIQLEANRFAPVTCEQDFHDLRYLEGEGLAHFARNSPVMTFGQRMSGLRSWTPVPILLACAEAGGPCDHQVFEKFVAMITRRLRREAPVDAVYISGHGAGITTRCDDLDGPYFTAVRNAVGPSVPIVADLDYHANISREMLEAVDIIVGYRTNPHVDMAERSAECAELIDRLLEGMKVHVAASRLPLVLPTVSQLTATGEPCGEIVEFGQSLVGGEVINVSIFPGFAFADTPYNGFTIVVTALRKEAADRAVAQISERVRSLLHRFHRRLTPLAEAGSLAVLAERDKLGPVVLADVGDNPGGGGRGNTMWILESLVSAGAANACLGVIFDPAVVADALAAGEGAAMIADFNRQVPSELSTRYTQPATVERLTDGKFIDHHGMGRGAAIDLGPSCLLRIGAVRVAVSSKRHQIYSTDFFAHFGIDIRSVSAFAVKSRGHFRAGFEHIVSPERIYEIDAPGLTSPNLQAIPWKHLPRPLLPLDPDTLWEPRPVI